MFTTSRAPGRAFALKRIAALGAAALAAIGLTLGAAAPALAHDELVGIDSTFNTDNTRFLLTLQFSNEVMEIGSELVASGEDGTDLIDGTPVISGRNVMQSIVVPETDQVVVVNWSVVSSDGHRIQDTLQIHFAGEDTTVELSDSRVSDGDDSASAGSASEGAPADGEAHDHDHDHGEEAATVEEGSNSGQPVALWVAFTVAIIAAVGTSAIVAVKRKKRGFGVDGADASGNASDGGADNGNGNGNGGNK